MHARPKFTKHSRVRTAERSNASNWEISECIRCKRCYWLPKQTHNKRVSLVHINGESLVVVHTHSTKEIITVMRLKMYIERNPELMEDLTVQAYLQKDNEHAASSTVSA